MRIIIAPPVRQAFFPLDKRWHLGPSVHSPSRAKQVVWLASLVAYAEASAICERIGHFTAPSTSIWREVQTYGPQCQAYVQAQADHTAPERVVLPPAGADTDDVKGMGVDGGTINIRDEGWKEFKVGTIGTVVVQTERDPDTGDDVERAHTIDPVCCAVLGSVELFAPHFWRLAVQQGVPSAKDSVLTADGADWIWNLAADYLPDSVQIVDWYHALQHLSQAANVLYPTDAAAAKRWFDAHTDDLFQGHVTAIITALKKANHPEAAHYFETHQRRMRYQEFREDGYPLGSGTVESSIKQFKFRLAGAGMRWNRSNAEQMLTLRSASLSKTFDTLWANAVLN